MGFVYGLCSGHAADAAAVSDTWPILAKEFRKGIQCRLAV